MDFLIKAYFWPSPDSNGAHCTKSDQDLRRIIFEDNLAVWQSFRDPENGVWCDTLRFKDTPMVTCGNNNNFYSSAGTGISFFDFLSAVHFA